MTNEYLRDRDAYNPKSRLGKAVYSQKLWIQLIGLGTREDETGGSSVDGWRYARALAIFSAGLAAFGAAYH